MHFFIRGKPLKDKNIKQVNQIYQNIPFYNCENNKKINRKKQIIK